MLLDLTPLKVQAGSDWKPCGGRYATVADFGAAPVAATTGPFVGHLDLRDAAGGGLSVDGALVARVEVAAGTARIGLRIKSPVPLYCALDALTLDLAYAAPAARWQVVANNLSWCRDTTGIAGHLQDWLTQAGTAGLRLNTRPTAHGPLGGFPLEQLGVSSGAPLWTSSPSSHRGWLGLFQRDAASMLLFLPTGEITNNMKDMCGHLPLLGLDKPTLGQDTASSAQPMQLAPVLLSHALRGGDPGAWRAIVQWTPLPSPPTPKVTTFNALAAAGFLGALWNDPVRASLRGAHVSMAGQPLVPLPTLAFDLSAPTATDPSPCPLLVFDIPAPGPGDAVAAAALRRVHISPNTRGKVTATFGWQSGAVGFNAAADPSGAAPVPPPASLQAHTVVFEANVNAQDAQVPKQGVAGWTRFPAGGADNDVFVDCAVDACAPVDASPDTVFELDLPNGKAHLASDPAAGTWLAWGSLEVQIPPQTAAHLACRLTGVWTKDRCDLYPETDLTLSDCKVRVGASADLDRDLTAAFDTLDADEDSRQRETDLLRHAIGAADAGIVCDVRIRHKTAPGRNAVTQVEVLSKQNQPTLGAPALALQIRPFMVAKSMPPSLDDENGGLIATWTSVGATGAQWMVPDSTVECLLPPSVGEAMERGVRFWDKDAKGAPAPIIDPGRVLPFRFTPPSSLTVQPSVVARRYNRSPSDLGAVLRAAKVAAFTTEIAYPVQASFQTSDWYLPDIRIAETGTFLGQPSPNLPVLPQLRSSDDKGTDRWRFDLRGMLQSSMSSEPAYYATRPGTSLASLQGVASSVGALRAAQSDVRSSFVARLAQHHLMDAGRSDRGLQLSDGLTFRIRDTFHGAPPLRPVLPNWELIDTPTTQDPAAFTPSLNIVDLTQQQKAAIHGDPELGQPTFLKAVKPDTQDTPAAPAAAPVPPPPPAWGGPDDGAIPAGVVHTIEFPSELVAVLRNPVSTDGAIDALAFTPLGTTGSFRCAFDEGRTVFVAESQHGQLSRLVKIRIGRIGVLWNKARHIIVYERSTVPSQQFQAEQEFGTTDSRGWPILRKTEEYIEPIEALRSFDDEQQGDQNSTAFVAASEFVSSRIYVNGAWGKDLGTGYELPLWNARDSSGFYPKPLLALQVRGSSGQVARCWHDEPQSLYFYSDTQVGTGADPDLWAPLAGVDGPGALTRLPVLANADTNNDEILAAPVMAAPRPGGLRRPRFDFAVVSDGKADLQHGRGTTQMLAALDVVSLARSGSASPLDEKSPNWADLQKLGKLASTASDIASAHELESRADALISGAVERLLSAGGGCSTIKQQLTDQVQALFDDASAKVASCKDSSKDLKLAQIHIARAAVHTLRDQVCSLDTVLAAPVLALRDDIARLRRGATEKAQDFRVEACGHLKQGRDQVDAAFATVAARIAALSLRLSSVKAGVDGQAGDILALLTTMNGSISQIARDLDALAALPPPAVVPAVASLASRLGALQAQCDRLASNPVLGELAGRVGALLGAARQALTWGEGQVAAALRTLLAPLQTAAHRLADCIGTLTAAATQALKAFDTAANDAKLGLNAQRKAVQDSFTQWVADVTAAADDGLDQALVKVLGAIDLICAQADASAAAVALTVVARWRTAVTDAFVPVANAADEVDTGLNVAQAQALALAGAAATLVGQAADAASDWLADARTAALSAIAAIDCAQLESTVRQMESKVRGALQDAEASIRDRVTTLATDIIDASTRQQLQDLETQAASAADKMGVGLKLVKAIGELPALPTLDFNAVRAEYVFDDLQKQIATSPFAAKLRDIDAGMKELGLAVPAKALCDQIVPKLDGLDFSNVFRNFGGIDFKGLFSGLHLPDLDPTRVQITHGIDDASRSAWVRANVNVDIDDENSIFEFSGLAVRMASMKLRARSDARIGLDGARRSSTDASLKGNWGLDFGGSRLATFRDVTVRYDGSSFKFDISPDKIELNPALKFVSDLAATLKPDLPPGVELISDARGLPVGARASMSINTPELSLGAVALGPMLIAAGLSLQLRDTGQFVIATHVSVGSPTAPIWVQIGYLGGGLWLEAHATFEGTVHYGATLGLAVGSMRAIDIAGIARGAYSLLLFADAEIGDGGGSLRAGFSMAGSARILGIANASVFLLLEVVQQNGGSAQGHGVLEVSVKVCWCYTINVRKQVQQAIGG